MNDYRYIPTNIDASTKIAIETVRINTLDFEPVNPMHFNDTITCPWNLSSGAEEPFRRMMQNQSHRKRDVIAELYDLNRKPNFKTWEHDIKKRFDKHKGNLECVKVYDILMNARSHIILKGEENKLRAVYGYPFPNLAVEMQFFHPIMEAIKKIESHIAFGCETLNGGMHTVNGMLLRDHLYLCIDWKKFDKSVRTWLIREAFKLIKSKIDFSHYRACPERGHPRRRVESDLENLFDYMVEFFCHGPICEPDGSRWKRLFAGIPSGSQFTQLIDSIVNLIVIISTLVEMVGIEAVKNILVLGDDSVTVIKTLMNENEFLEEFSQIAQDKFGMEVNITKSASTRNPDEVNFLGYQNRNGNPVRDMKELHARFILPEGDPTAYSKILGRSIGHAWASCGIDTRMFDVVAHVADFVTPHNVVPDYGELAYLDRVIEEVDLKWLPNQWLVRSKLRSPGRAASLRPIVVPWMSGG